MTERKPRIGIVADQKSVSSGAWKDVLTDGIPHSYLEAVVAAGGYAVLLPAIEESLAEVDWILETVDGLFLPGGRDIDASLYGASEHPENDPPFLLRDQLELELVRRARTSRMPIFGACRGMQIINVALGGTLTQHLDDVTELTPHRDIIGKFTSHPVSVLPGTRLSNLIDRKSIDIASHHHQSVDLLGAGLLGSAVAHDGIVEALELDGEGFCIGVQWHPEEQLHEEGLALISAFVSEARNFAISRDYALARVRNESRT